MNNLKNVEIIRISTIDGKLFALISYQNLEKMGNENNGYDIIKVPINPRKIQTSTRGNCLVDQSVKNYKCKANEPAK